MRPLLVAIGGYDTAASALLLFLFGVVGIVGNLAGGVAVDRWGIAPAIVGAIAGNAIALHRVAGAAGGSSS